MHVVTCTMKCVMQSDKLTFYYIVIVPMMRRGCKREK